MVRARTRRRISLVRAAEGTRLIPQHRLAAPMGDCDAVNAVSTQRGAVVKERRCDIAYTRGNTYAWPSEDRLHIWTATHADPHARTSGWAHGRDPATIASVAIPHKTFDELVVMRYAEMTPKERKSAERRAVKKWEGNGGCLSLAERLRKRKGRS